MMEESLLDITANSGDTECEERPVSRYGSPIACRSGGDVGVQAIGAIFGIRENGADSLHTHKDLWLSVAPLRGSLCNGSLLDLARKIDFAHFSCAGRHSCTCTKTTIHSITYFKLFVFCSIFSSLNLSHVTAKIKVQISRNFED